MWGVVNHSPWELSDALRRLRVTHTLDPIDKGAKTKRINLKRSQPLPVHVTTRLDKLRVGAVNFIVTSHSQLSGTNIPPLYRVRETLEEDLKAALTSARLVSLEMVAVSVVDYINMVAKPSLLNKIETQILSITPYALRKEAKVMVLDFFNGRASDRALSQFMSRSLRLEQLKSIVLQGKNLRAAVARKKAGGDAELIGAEMGVPAFDIMYLFNAGNPKPKPERNGVKPKVKGVK